MRPELVNVVNVELERYLDLLHTPLRKKTAEHLQRYSMSPDTPDLALGSAELLDMYKESGILRKAGEMLKKFSENFSESDLNLVTALSWIHKYGTSADKHTDYIELGDKILAYEDRKLTGVKVVIGELNPDFRIENAKVEPDESFVMNAFFKHMSGHESDNGVTWILQSARIIENDKDGDPKEFILESTVKKGPKKTGDKFVMELGLMRGSLAQTVATWENELNSKRFLTEGKLNLAKLKGIRSPNGNFLVDLIFNTFDGFAFNFRRARTPEKTFPLEVNMSEGLNIGNGVTGVVFRNAAGAEIQQTVSVAVDNTHVHSPRIKVYEYETAIEGANKSGRTQKSVKSFPLRPVNVFLNTIDRKRKASMKQFREGLAGIRESVLGTLYTSEATT